MSEIVNAIILGVVQGLTEFLPVSSSGHIELAKYFLDDETLDEQSMLLTVVLHFGTALSTIWVCRQDILDILKGLFTFRMNEAKMFSLKIILSMIPAVIIGLVFMDQIESLFIQNIPLIAVMLVITGILLFLADRAKNTDKDISFLHAIIIGIAQAIAIMPGISRSGATISTSVLLGVDRTKAARFSFLMVVPLIFGKMAQDLLSGDLMGGSISVSVLVVGFLAAFITGIFACSWMIKLVQNSNLKYFSFYCFIIAIVSYILYQVWL